MGKFYKYIDTVRRIYLYELFSCERMNLRVAVESARHVVRNKESLLANGDDMFRIEKGRIETDIIPLTYSFSVSGVPSDMFFGGSMEDLVRCDFIALATSSFIGERGSV